MATAHEYARISLNDLDDPDTSVLDTGNSSREVKVPLRPHVYYDEGPFDAPSSESEDEALLEKDAVGHGQRGSLSLETAENGFPADGILRGQQKRPNTLRCLLITLASLVLVSVLVGIFAAFAYTGTSFAPVRGTRPLTMDHVFNGTFSAHHASLRWVPEAGDGVYAEQDFKRSVITLVDLKTNTTRDLVKLADMKDDQGGQIGVAEWKLSHDMKYLLIKTDYQKQWRHSSFGNYYVHDIDARSTYALTMPSHPAVTAYAAWSPTGDAIAYVHKNDLYVKPNAAPSTRAIRLTATGSETHFNGVPDWVYEEEVFAADFALWWSPDAKRLTFLESDETDVDVYTFPIYNPSMNAHEVYPYTEEVAMRYPKPGYANPSVAVHVFDLDGYLSDAHGDDEEDDGQDTEDDEVPDEVSQHLSRLTWSPRRPAGESIVFDVTWIGDNDLLVKEVNRAADDGVVVHFKMSDLSIESAEIHGSIVRRLGRNGEEGDDGWIESRQTIYPLPPSLVSTLGYSDAVYLDLVNNSEGYTHIALFSPADSSEPVFVTNGEWEVVEGVLSVDARGIVYFAAAYPSSIERAILAVPVPSLSPTVDENRITALTTLTDTSTLAWYEASFSPEAGYYLLGYRGPNVPWQSIFSTTVPREDLEYKVTENAQLNATLAEYQSPLTLHSTIENDGYELNAMELLPPNFDDSGRTKYPVLFRVYGGPASQMVHARFDRDWHSYLVCGLKYIVVVVDGRGTGFKGRALRNPIRGNLGYWETRDQVEAARLWASKKYVDPKRIGIWGWSYGGFMSSKVTEADDGIHSLAMAVAPVTSWRLYDSIYTERYMSTPSLNPSGYTNASITNVTGFRNTHFLLAHGSGDDNVHFANSAHLLDMLTQDQVRNFRFRMFTDSDHSINRRGAYRELYEFMTEFLLEKWGLGGTKRRW